MKKIGNFIVTSIVLFGSYFLASTFGMMVIQTLMRLFVDANSRGEYLWKTIYIYACITAICILHLKITATTQKTKFLTYMSGKKWSFKESISYILKSSDFWLNSIGFALWPMIVPKLFGVVNLLYFSPSVVENFPQSLLSALTVSLPILIFSGIGWELTLRRWYQSRMHTV